MIEVNEKECKIKANQVGAKIKFYRKQAGLTQEQLGLHIQSSQDYISEIERGKSFFTVYFLYKISIALNIDISSFFID